MDRNDHSAGVAEQVLPGLAPAGWYPDPARRWRLRWWDGAEWTEGVSDGSRVAHEALTGPDPDGRARLPVRAIWWAVGGIVIGELIGGVLALLASFLTNDRYVFELVFGQLGLWLGFAGAIVIVSRRYGSGHPFTDLGVRMKRSDPAWALLYSVGLRIAAAIAVLPLVLGFRHYFDHLPPSNLLEGHNGDLGAEITISLIAAIGAPFIEEMLFRGVIMGSLRRLGPWWAIVIQGLVFGAVHLTPAGGRSNYLTFVAIGLTGMGLGYLATRFRRLGPGMWTHFYFNLLAVALIGWT